MEGRKPRIAQQPTTKAVITSNQQVNIDSRSYILYNYGTDVVWVDNFPIPPGMTFSEGATEDGVMCYRMNVRFDFAEGKTQALYIRILDDIKK